MMQDIYVKRVYPFLVFLPSLPGVVMDVGANIGRASIFFRACYPGVPIFALEPDPETFAYLQANAAPLADIKLFNIGLYERNGEATLYRGLQASVTNSFCASMQSLGGGKTITLRRASEFIMEHAIERIWLLKIDTEGAEVPILQDIEHLFPRIDAIFLEFHSEKDRLEIDRLLSDQYMLCQAVVPLAHRGTLAYIAKEVVAAHTNLNLYEIARPSI